MLLSILTVALNSERHISECLSSTVEICQNEHVQHVLVDGGSTDRTLIIARRFAHVKIYNIKDIGVYDAMNKAVGFAEGKYTCYLNSDDVFLLKSVDFLRSNRLWYTGLVEYINDNGNILRKDNPYTYSFKRLLVSNIIRHPATFVNTYFIKANGFNLKYRYAADYDFFLRIAKVSEPVVLDIFCARFRVWHGGLSSSFIKSLNNELKVRYNWRIYTRRLYYFPIDLIIYSLRLFKIYVNSFR